MKSPFHYEPNIISNPFTHYGTWTPDGWRVHEKRWATTKAVELFLSGDGKRTRFELSADFVEDVHDKADPHTDGGIYPSEPHVEYPVGRPRWAISHTFLAYPFADKTLYEMEYVYDRVQRTLDTFFREHVVCEEAVTDHRDGMTVRVKHTPISRVIVGNKAYPHCNSAVRGVWASPEKRAPNFHTRERLMRLPSANAVYIRAPHTPVVQCFGLWKAEPSDSPVTNRDALIAAGIPLDAPSISSLGYGYRNSFSKFYNANLDLIAERDVVVHPASLERLRACKGVPFREHAVGYAAWQKWDHDFQVGGVPGCYCNRFDFNGNGLVDAEDEETLRRHIGNRYRVNYYTGAYYGWNWLSVGVCLNLEMQSEPVICQWLQGAGYDAETGTIRLFETPGPNQKIFVEYHYDKPAATGRDNIRIVLRQAAE